jgi:hypothetical protein
MKSFIKGGTTRRTACGITTDRRDCQRESPSARDAAVWLGWTTRCRRDRPGNVGGVAQDQATHPQNHPSTGNPGIRRVGILNPSANTTRTVGIRGRGRRRWWRAPGGEEDRAPERSEHREHERKGEDHWLRRQEIEDVPLERSQDIREGLREDLTVQELILELRPVR